MEKMKVEMLAELLQERVYVKENISRLSKMAEEWGDKTAGCSQVNFVTGRTAHVHVNDPELSMLLVHTALDHQTQQLERMNKIIADAEELLNGE